MIAGMGERGAEAQIMLGEFTALGAKNQRSAGVAALGHDGGVQALAEFGGELVDFVFAIDGDGLAGGVEHDFAVMALADVGLDFGEELGIDFAVEVVGELGEKIGAGHGLGPPFFCRK
jgi:hypothetical protein